MRKYIKYMVPGLVHKKKKNVHMVKVEEGKGGSRSNMYNRLSPRNALEKSKFWRPLKI